jgi:hypothetical protein
VLKSAPATAGAILAAVGSKCMSLRRHCNCITIMMHWMMTRTAPMHRDRRRRVRASGSRGRLLLASGGCAAVLMHQSL